MEIKMKLSVLSMLIFVILSNVGCEGRELSSNFLIESRVTKKNGWCGADEGSCSKYARAHEHTHGNWECCSKKYCVDVSSDSFNCGKCGHACGYGLSCCKGKCVDLNTDKAHCGSCSNRCHHDKCAFGICGYAHS
ncbi:protein GRIM REAPER [Cryptomeria japonica]|uniref:protein GRIM REAPER n=1 Tax=Cryptomeria japonica TaxID=3369 RepID=UPI0027D9E658|nr:protein GRIM REAPER [Cryptomeria japonica]